MPSWARLCRESSSERLKRHSHPGQLQINGFSPVWRLKQTFWRHYILDTTIIGWESFSTKKGVNKNKNPIDPESFWWGRGAEIGETVVVFLTRTELCNTHPPSTRFVTGPDESIISEVYILNYRRVIFKITIMVPRESVFSQQIVTNSDYWVI